MIEHCSEFVPDVDVLRCVTLPAVPNVYGLEEPDQGVAHWVFALPGGQAYIVSSDEEGVGALVHTDLAHVMEWWAPFHGAELVLVTAQSSSTSHPASSATT